VPTIGVSIAIPEPHGDELQVRRAAFGDPMAWSIPAHVTLLPPTVTDAETLEKFTTHLEEVSARTEPFSMVLRGTGTFRPVSPVVFVQVSRGIAECEMLERAVRSGPVDRIVEFHYHPHVTVAQDVPDASLDLAFRELADFEAEFTVDEVHLYEHGSDAVWRPVRAFSLLG
jgi:2'-5' RNA ligase